MRVVRINDFLGVVAKTEWAAVRAAATLEAKWSDWAGLPDIATLPDFLRQCAVDHDETPVKRGDAEQGDVRRGQARSPRSFDYPYQGHASMGPSCAVADWRPDGLTVWTGSQSTHLFRNDFRGELRSAARKRSA